MISEASILWRPFVRLLNDIMLRDNYFVIVSIVRMLWEDDYFVRVWPDRPWGGRLQCSSCDNSCVSDTDFFNSCVRTSLPSEWNTHEVIESPAKSMWPCLTETPLSPNDTMSNVKNWNAKPLRTLPCHPSLPQGAEGHLEQVQQRGGRGTGRGNIVTTATLERSSYSLIGLTGEYFTLFIHQLCMKIKFLNHF